MTAPTRPGLFLAFEGGEGVGKTTQIAALADRLEATGEHVVRTREPGATPIGQAIRRLLLDPATTDLDKRAEALLFAADRAQHVATVIGPALAAGHIVITDRYMDSSAAYQGAGRALGHDEVLHLSRWGSRDTLPDLTILLDADPRVGLARATTTEFGEPDRIESERIEFLDAARAGFLALAARAPHRYLVLDATLPAESLTARIWEAVAELRTLPMARVS